MSVNLNEHGSFIATEVDLIRLLELGLWDHSCRQSL
jgi:hypothetical protein